MASKLAKLLSVLVFLGLSGPAFAAWPTLNGHGTAPTTITSPTVLIDDLSTSILVGNPTGNTVASASIGNLVCAMLAPTGVTSAVGGTLVDSAGNSYSMVVESSDGVHIATSLWCDVITSSLPTNSTFTFSGVGGHYFLEAVSSNASGGTDKTSTSNVVLGTTVTTSTGTLSQAKELVLAGIFWTVNPSSGFTEPSGFTTLTTGSVEQNGQGDFAYHISSTTSSVTYNPTWTGNSTGTAFIASFK